MNRKKYYLFNLNQMVFEDVYAARDSATLEQLKELSSKRRVIEESINESSFVTEAIAREMYGGFTSPLQQVSNYFNLCWLDSIDTMYSCYQQQHLLLLYSIRAYTRFLFLHTAFSLLFFNFVFFVHEAVFFQFCILKIKYH